MHPQKDNSITTKGFTLIELLVVIGIIALLSTIVMAALGSAKEKANVSRAKADILTIAKAVEVARSNTRGKTLITITGSSCTHCSATSSPAAYIAAMDKIALAGDNIYANIRNIVYDPGGVIYRLDENEGEAGRCNRDSIVAPGLKVSLTYLFEFATDTCKASTTVTTTEGFSY